MQCKKEKVSITKWVFIDSHPSDAVLDILIQSISEDVGNGGIPWPTITNSFRLETIITPGIMASSSNPEKQFIMFEETADLEFLAYNKRQQTLVKQKKRKIRSSSRKVQESLIEEQILDIKRTKLTDFLEAVIVFNQTTVDKSKKEEKYILRLEKRILELEEHVELERSNRIKFNKLKG